MIILSGSAVRRSVSLFFLLVKNEQQARGLRWIPIQHAGGSRIAKEWMPHQHTTAISAPSVRTVWPLTHGCG